MEVSAHNRTVRTHGGVYLGTFFCMKASAPRWTRITDSGRSSSSRDEPVAHPVQVVHQVPLGRARSVEQRLVEVGQRYRIPHLIAHLGILPR